jgi:transcriptional regulator with XRE-family HTH domain
MLPFLVSASNNEGMNMKSVTSELHDVFLANVRRRRASLGLSQTQVADRIGIDQPHYSNLERGVFRPSFDILEQLAEALETTAADLLKQPKVST